MMNSIVCAKEISTVLFITDLESIRNGIKTAIRETYFPEWEKPIGSVSLKAWQKDPLAALIIFPDKTFALTELALNDQNKAA